MKTISEDVRGAFALVAVVVGAGFASGREVLRFFTVFGPWSYLACVMASVVLAGLSAWAAMLSARLHAHNLTQLSQKSLGGMIGNAAAWLNGALVTATAGAMLAAMGEIVSLALPVHGAYWIGILLSLLLGGWMARQGLSALAVVGGLIVPVCLLLYWQLLDVPAPAPSSVHGGESALRAVVLASAYAAMNAALGCGVLCEMGRGRTRAQVVRQSALAGALLLMLLLFANAALYPHRDALHGEALPAVQLARSLGPLGYWLCLLTLMLAIMTTLTALLRTLERMLFKALPEAARVGLSLFLPLAVGISGFEAIVSGVYPILGAACTVLFFAMIVKGRRQGGVAVCPCARP